MISKEQFIETINTIQNYNDYIDRAHDIMGIDLYDSEMTVCFYKLESIILTSNFNEDTIETIYWWLYEYEDKSKPAMWDDSIPLHDAEDLWEYCKQGLL